LGGVLTTVEGLLEKIHDHLSGHNPFADSDEEFGRRMKELLDSLMEMRTGKRKFTLRLVDPLAHSFMQNPYAPGEDRNVTKFLRDRTFEENEMLGFNDMKVENYQEGCSSAQQ
jgi:zinc finger protein